MRIIAKIAIIIKALLSPKRGGLSVFSIRGDLKREGTLKEGLISNFCMIRGGSLIERGAQKRGAGLIELLRCHHIVTI